MHFVMVPDESALSLTSLVLESLINYPLFFCLLEFDVLKPCKI